MDNINYFVTDGVYVFKGDYMLLYSGDGAPLMPIIAKFFASKGLRGIYTAIMLITYLPISLLVVGIIIGIEKLINLITKNRKEERLETAKQE